MDDIVKAYAMLSSWKKRLALSDWNIKIKINCSPEEMTLQDVSGEVDWSEAGKCAIIRIIDPAYYGDRIVPFDFETTLIHELLHLKFTLIGDDVPELQERVVHQIIDDLARGFVLTKWDGKSKREHEEQTTIRKRTKRFFRRERNGKIR